MTRLRLHHAAVLVLLAGVLTPLAHAVDENEPLSMVFESSPEPGQRPDEAPVPAFRIAQRCTLFVARVDDIRRNKSHMGNLTRMLPTVHATPRRVESLRGGDAVPWVRDALLATRRYGFDTLAEAPPAAGLARRQLGAEVSLRLAHAWSVDLNLVSHVAIKVDYRLPGGATVSRQYHGMGTRANWASANGEFMTVLNLGLEEAVRGMVNDAERLCDGRPLPPEAP